MPWARSGPLYRYVESVPFPLSQGHPLIPSKIIPNQRGVPVDWADQAGGGGQTSLHLAAIAGHVDAVQALIELGADVNKINDISAASPLHLAGSYVLEKEGKG